MFSRNETIVRTAVETTMNAGDLDQMDKFFSQDVRRYAPESPRATRGLDAYRAHLAAVLAACPDGFLVIEDTILAEDLVGFWWTYYGTQPAGRLGTLSVRMQIELHGCQVMRLCNGMIVDVWETGDDLAQITEEQPVAVPVMAMA